MPAAPDPTLRESRVARRLARLFRIERAGGFARRPTDTVWRMIRRRGELLAALAELEQQRRADPAPAAGPELQAAVAELASEVELSRLYNETVVETLGAELRARRGAGVATGLRDLGPESHLLGRG